MTSPRLLAHVLWPSLKPHVVVEECKDGRARLELNNSLSRTLLTDALRMCVCCVACGADIHPVRSRKRPGNKRSKVVGHGLYLAVACPLPKRIGCSRGKEARSEYTLIRAAVMP